MDTTSPPVPNHHAGHPGFAGIGGVLAGLTMIVGRGPTARLAADLTAVTDRDHVVDVGCGPGTAVREAARRGAQVTAVDPAAVMLRLARVLTLGRRERVRWLDGAAEALPLDDASATVLWSVATVHHWADLDGGLREAFRVLASGGRFLAAERRVRPGAKGHASHGWTDDQADAFASQCLAAGFIEVGVASERPRDRATLIVLAARP